MPHLRRTHTLPSYPPPCATHALPSHPHPFRHSCAPSRHSCAPSRHSCAPSVIPAQAGTQPNSSVRAYPGISPHPPPAQHHSFPNSSLPLPVGCAPIHRFPLEGGSAPVHPSLLPRGKRPNSSLPPGRGEVRWGVRGHELAHQSRRAHFPTRAAMTEAAAGRDACRPGYGGSRDRCRRCGRTRHPSPPPRGEGGRDGLGRGRPGSEPEGYSRLKGICSTSSMPPSAYCQMPM